MAVKEGYKQTEIGIIPEDWDYATIGELFDFRNGLNKGKEFFGYGVPIINYNDVYLKTEIRAKDVLGRVSLTKNEIKLFEVKKGDVFFTRTSETPEEIGISSVLTEDIKDTVFSGFVLRARPRIKKLDLHYKKYCFSTKLVRKEIVSNCTYTTRALTNGTVLSKITIPLPPRPEQKAIATALSDIDGLIDSISKLIEKKKNIKQGAMQELLTGKKRLEGFSGEWVEAVLGDFASFSKGSGLSKAEITDHGEDKCIHYGELFTDYKAFIDIVKSRTNFEGKKVLSENNFVLMPTSDVTPRGLATASFINEQGVIIGGDILIIRCSNSLDGLFLSYVIRYDKSQVLQLVTGTTVYHLYASDMRKFCFMVPPTIEEQTAIATIISDMDSEIEKLQTKLEKYKAIKQGMMQELLTGRIRLLEGA